MQKRRTKIPQYKWIEEPAKQWINWICVYLQVAKEKKMMKMSGKRKIAFATVCHRFECFCFGEILSEAMLWWHFQWEHLRFHFIWSLEKKVKYHFNGILIVWGIFLSISKEWMRNSRNRLDIKLPIENCLFYFQTFNFLYLKKSGQSVHMSKFRINCTAIDHLNRQ